ncbi:MAG TPA: TetR/AcrR family transcriptional regulator [Ilumatobacteraceae bacterium]|nr:TetR/AcrR family transcriptional regulator [Ilumatobacteraceae bacterium]
MGEVQGSRSQRARQAVLDATADLVAEVGVERTTIDEIASRSGVAKTTIYRHFSSKQALVVEAVHACTHIPVVTDTGSLRDDLISCFSGTTKASYDGRLGDMMLSLMDAAQRDPELGRLVRAQTDQRRRFATEVIERAVWRGDLPADVDVDLLVTLVAGPLVYTKLVRRQRVTDELVAAVVDSVLSRFEVDAQPTV